MEFQQMLFIRHLLELKTVDEAIKYLQEVPHDIPNQFSVADSSGKIACVECFPNRVYVKSDDVYLVHTTTIYLQKMRKNIHVH